MNYHDSLFRLFFVTPLLAGSNWLDSSFRFQNTKDLGMLTIDIRLMKLRELYIRKFKRKDYIVAFSLNLLNLVAEYKGPGFPDN